MYAYVGNNPGNFVDPSGTEKKERWDKLDFYEKFGEGYYYRAGYGDEAFDRWFDLYYNSDGWEKLGYGIPTAFSAMWKPETYQGTLVAIIIGGGLESARVRFGGGRSSWPGNDPAKAPSGTKWRGKPGSKPGDGKGNYHNPKSKESYRPDLDHPEPIGPHWDYRDGNGQWHRIFPDGTTVPKN